MLFLRYVYVLALVVWLGGLVVAGGVAAPAIFAVLEGWNAAEGRVLAGQVFGEVLNRLHPVAYVCGGVMFAALTLHRLLGSRPVKYGIRVSLIAAMLALALGSGLAISPRVAALQREVSGPIAALPEGDARRAEFYRWHGYSNLLLTGVALGGLVLLFWEARE
jgi:Domain of unknown function (DUF4149)